jgi:hypothetical protein
MTKVGKEVDDVSLTNLGNVHSSVYPLEPSGT